MIAFPVMKNGNIKEGFKITSYYNKGVACWAVPGNRLGRSSGTVLPQTLLGNRRTADSTATAQLSC